MELSQITQAKSRKGGKMNITNPLTGKEEHISSVLFSLAGQGGPDGYPYNQMQVAGEYILALEVCRDHWKNSYYAIYKTIGILLEFHSRWKGISQGWNTAMRGKRNKEAYKIIKEIVEKRNNTNRPPEVLGGEI